MRKVSRRGFMKTGAALGLVGAPAAATASVTEATATSALPAAASYPFRWWVSFDGGEVFVDECETREEAVRIAERNGGGMIAECQQQDFDLRLSGDRLFEMMHDANEEIIGDGDFIDCTDAQLQELEDQVNAVIIAWAERHRLNGTAWVFGATRNKEDIAPAPTPHEGEK